MRKCMRVISVVALAMGLMAWAAGAAPPAGASPVSRIVGGSRFLNRGRGPGPSDSTVGLKADFNGDGFGDLAVGVPGEGLGSVSGAGGVNVLYGTASGLSSNGNRFWSQGSAGVIGSAESGDAFGQTVATGDFNKDGYTDLAIGVPDEGIGSAVDAGGVNVLYGTASGLSSNGNQFWSQSSHGVNDTSESGDEFGTALAARDFNGDGYADLAVGVPHEAGGSATDEGAVNVIYGSSGGLVSTGSQLVAGENAGDEFGSALAAGNFNSSGGRDLAVGAPRATNGSLAEAGVVYWLTGTSSGLQGLHPTTNFEPKAGAFCGASLASGNFDNDASGYADVAAGCPHATYELHDEGAVDVHFGSGAGLGNGSVSYVLGAPQAGAELGTSLAIGDFGADEHHGSDDIAAGVPFYRVHGKAGAGAVLVIYSGSTPNDDFEEQGSTGIVGVPEAGDHFGAAVTTGNFNGDGFADIAIGVPGEGVGNKHNSGGINVIFGSTNRLTPMGNRFWSQNSSGIIGTAEAGDMFGASLSGRVA